MEPRNQLSPTSFTRPSARAATAAPVNRGSYGLPPRPSAAVPQPAAQPSFVAAPAPQQAPQPTYAAAPAPQPVQQPVVAPVQSAPTPQAQPIISLPPAPVPTATAQPPLPQSSAPRYMDVAPPQAAQARAEQPIATAPQPAAVRPLFTPSNPVQQTAKPTKKHHLFKFLQISVFVVAGLLFVAGVGRYATAGSTANDTIAVGAVSANDGRSMTIQFTATDGKLHKFSTKTNRDMIPGTATEIAYRSGAPDATAHMVSLIKQARSLGFSLVLAAVITAAVGGIMVVIAKLKAHKSAPKPRLTTTVAA